MHIRLRPFGLKDDMNDVAPLLDTRAYFRKVPHFQQESWPALFHRLFLHFAPNSHKVAD
jgi:hypothetical protein